MAKQKGIIGKVIGQTKEEYIIEISNEDAAAWHLEEGKEYTLDVRKLTGKELDIASITPEIRGCSQRK
jgi:hypothetical protein